ncbi:hypothetical protein [Primorskyibacter flagellatus]|uniref:Predicted 5' DNA nuclease, flap endonuclease-1-like, helix-3-turn-helix (H3TH) domain n=1 Tax=Primorskyibacter flagellatus TaxID=1387277 RepID=A0A1W2BIE2_9RHOB|nr:hypothetical protein [Primorskyibacter flagellatus]SMC72687.1 Predicted 5' DNA nuclease, flap endonuclease-1-like, helix-3-turn-helix (H3TH) domain [Primorskyibacter flagellatus]
MTQSGSGYSCQTKCWGLAAALGVVTLILALSVRGYGWGTSIFLGVLVVALLGLLLTWLMCSDVPKLGQSMRAKGISNGPGTAGAGSGSDSPMSLEGVTGTESARPAAKSSTPNAEGSKTAEPAPAEKKVVGQTATDGASEASAGTTPTEAATADKPQAKAKDDAAAKAKNADAATPKTAAGDKTANGPVVKPSAVLSGEAELSSRKGSWKYEAAKPDDASNPAKAEPTSADSGGDHDGGDALEGSKPETLTKARDGGADNLKEIKGVGPKLETLLNEMGFYHFDQVANWTAGEVAWVDANLSGFKGRVSRDDWVEQAKILAAGGDTEFSKRVDKGDVY